MLPCRCSYPILDHRLRVRRVGGVKKLLLALLVGALLAGCGDDELKKKVQELEDELEQVKKGKDDAQGNDVAPSKKKAFTIPDLELEMLWCKPGIFTMGSPLSEADRSDDETQHAVTLTKGFWLGKHEVTQAQWQSIMGSNPSKFKGANLPVEKVSWDDVASFCAKLTERERKAGRLPEGYAYQLPTEAQWEYACRAGTRTAYSFGAAITAKQANHDNDVGQTTAVGSYPANAWGFHDMHGNVYEWCRDWYDDYPDGSVRNPMGPAAGSVRGFRGGSWLFRARDARSATRFRNVPVYRFDNLGFRLSFSVQGKAE